MSTPGRGRPPLWWPAAALLFGASFGTNVSTPLLPLYRHHLGLGPSDVNAIFGVYALGLAPSLLFGGPASDRYGRLRVLVPAVLLTAAASLVFVFGSGATPLLYLARFVLGLASGAAFSVGSAWLQDILGAGQVTAAARRASLSLNAGFCLGPLTAGLLGQYAPHPLVVPFLVHIALVLLVLAFAFAATGRSAAFAAGGGVRAASLWPRPGLDAAQRRVFRSVLIPTAVCVYAFPSVAATVLPLVLHSRHVVALSGVLGAVALGAGAAVQPFAHRLGGRRAPLGAALGAAGYALGVLATRAPWSGWVVLAGALLGAGAGLCLNAGLTLVQELSTPATRGACNGLFYTWAYVGFAAPLLTTAFVDLHHVARPLAVLAVLAALTALWLARRRVPVPGAVPVAGGGAHSGHG